MIGMLARSSVGKQSKTLRLLDWNSHLCYASKVKALLKNLSLPIVWTFISSIKLVTWKKHLTNLKEKIEKFILTNLYQQQETIVSVGFLYYKVQKLLRKWWHLILNQFVCKRPNSAKPLLQIGLAGTCQLFCINFIRLDWKFNLSMHFHPKRFGWVICWCYG